MRYHKKQTNMDLGSGKSTLADFWKVKAGELT